MTKQAVLHRVQADLQAAQAEIETTATIDGSVADSFKFGFKALRAAVGALFAVSDDHQRKIDEHDRQLKIALELIGDLQKRVHGLKVSRGKAVAAKERALTAIDNAKGVLDASRYTEVRAFVCLLLNRTEACLASRTR